MTVTETYPLSVNQLSVLHSDLHPSRRKTRKQGNFSLSYLEAYDVKATLIRVFGYGGFSAECLDAQILREEQAPQAQNSNQLNWSITARATVRITIHQTGAVYTETAIATNAQPQYGEAADTAMKSAESDALKRAAIYLGTQFGLSLYDDGTCRDVVRRVFAPDQEQVVEDLVLSRAGAEAGDAGRAARARLQERLKVHDAATRAAANADAQAPDHEPEPEPEPEPAKAPTGSAPKRAPKARQNAARAALAEAERATGMRAPQEP